MRLAQFLVGISRTHRALTMFVLALSLGSATPSDAQQPDCLEVKAQVVSDTIQIRHRAAWRALHDCGDIEAGAITAVLRHAVPKSDAENTVRFAAMGLQDVRLLDSVRVLALDRTRSVDQRMWDLSLLVNYVEPGSMLESADSGAVGVIGGPPTDTYQTIWGNEPPQEEDRARALATIVRMGRVDPDPILRRVAEKAAQELGYSPKKCPPTSIVDLPAQWLCSALVDLPK